MVRRVLLALTAIAMLQVGLVLPAATAATRSSITISSHVYLYRPPSATKGPTSRPTAMPGEEVVLSGSVTASGRVVVLQRLVAGSWREVARRLVTGVSWRFSTIAGVPARYAYRALALRTRTAGGVTSATRVVTVVKPTVAASVPTRVGAGRLVRFTGTASPARPGRTAQLWELRGPRWVAVADALQSSTGTFTFGQIAAPIGRHTYRVVTEDGDGRFDVRSPSRDVTTVRAATTGARSVYLADVTPIAVVYIAPRQVHTAPVDGRSYPKSISSVDRRLTWQLGDGMQSLSTGLVMQAPMTSDPLLNRNGPRLVEVRVDAVLRLRRFLKPGQVLPLTLDLRGKHTLSLTSYDRGPLDNGFGGAVVLATPVVSTAARTERGVDTNTALSELHPTARTGPVAADLVLGFLSNNLFGGSLAVFSGPSPTTVVGTFDYDLAGTYTSLTGVPLITGEGSAQTTGRVRLYGDGKLLSTFEGVLYRGVELGRATVDVTGVQRLRIELVADPTPDTWIYSWGVGLADPRLS